MGDIEARLARVHDIFVPLHDLIEVLRQFAFGAEQVDLHDEDVDGRRTVDGVPERRIRHDSAIPVALAVYLDRRERGRQRGTR